MNEHDEALRKQTAFLGQPKGVGTLSFMQLCNSFANYAMSAVLIYYLYANAPEGLGFSKANAAQLISLYSTVVVLTGIVGSFVCDRILGCRKSLFIARSLSFIGYVCLALPLGVPGYVWQSDRCSVADVWMLFLENSMMNPMEDVTALTRFLT